MTEYLLYNTATHETVTLCGDDDGECIAALQAEGWYMLLPENYPDSDYSFPAVYNIESHVVWDQSPERKTNGDWMMTSREVEAGDGDEHSHGDGDEHSHVHEDDHSNGDDGGNSDEETVSKVSSLEYIIYNYKTHASYSVPDELSGSGFVLLNESTSPDYYHPAVYNTTTHTVIDQSDDRNTSGDWMMLSKYNDIYTSSEESIDSIVSGNDIASFRLSQPVEMNDKAIAMCIVGTGGKDKIIGGDTSEILMGGSGKNKFTGGANADGFMFDNQVDFSKKLADKIKDFDTEEGDQILLDKEMFGLRKNLKFKSVSGRSKVNKASGTRKHIIYDESKGRLYFNENRKDDGWGDGGYFAKLTGAPELDVNDFMIV